MNDSVLNTGQAPSSEEQVPVKNLSYKRARDALVKTIKLLELGQVSLGESLALRERGEVLARRCEERLAGAWTRVEAALANKDQNVSASAENVGGED